MVVDHVLLEMKKRGRKKYLICNTKSILFINKVDKDHVVLPVVAVLDV